jgi:hypothetical protein
MRDESGKACALGVKSTTLGPMVAPLVTNHCMNTGVMGLNLELPGVFLEHVYRNERRSRNFYNPIMKELHAYSDRA